VVDHEKDDRRVSGQSGAAGHRGPVKDPGVIHSTEHPYTKFDRT
jgi:hypothetical protein